jgi:DnaK suppressor protein
VGPISAEYSPENRFDGNPPAWRFLESCIRPANLALQMQPLHLARRCILHKERLPAWTISCNSGYAIKRTTGAVMNTASAETGGFLEALERKEAELARLLRKRDDIAIEKSADQMDEIQYASERDLAIRNVDRDSSLLRDVRSALWRIRDGGFGACLECACPISPKRLAAVPWASRCIQCQEADERDARERTEGPGEALADAA